MTRITQVKDRPTLGEFLSLSSIVLSDQGNFYIIGISRKIYIYEKIFTEIREFRIPMKIPINNLLITLQES